MNPPHTVVFGGTKGMGRVFAQARAAQGQHVTVVGRSRPAASAADAGKLNELTCDLMDETSLDRAIDQLKGSSVRPSYLVFFQRYRGADDPWRGEIDTTLTAMRKIVDGLSESFAPNGDKAIAVVSSLAGRFIAPDQSLAYHLAKAGVLQLIQYFAVTLGRRGIRANAVSPGATVKPESEAYYAGQPRLHELYGKICPLGRMGRAEDVTQVVDFLCSPAAGFVNGQNLIVDGGISIQNHESLARSLTGV